MYQRERSPRSTGRRCLAAEVIALARQWGGTAPLSASDAHTLTIPIDGGVSYIPIPSGTGQNFAGLFTLEMPPGIRTGQEFEVVVRRISTKRGDAPAAAPATAAVPPSRRRSATSAPVRSPRRWWNACRRVSPRRHRHQRRPRRRLGLPERRRRPPRSAVAGNRRHCGATSSEASWCASRSARPRRCWCRRRSRSPS